MHKPSYYQSFFIDAFFKDWDLISEYIFKLDSSVSNCASKNKNHNSIQNTCVSYTILNTGEQNIHSSDAHTYVHNTESYTK